MKRRIVLIAAIFGVAVGGGLAVADALTSEAEPYKARPVELPAPIEDLTLEQRQQLANEDPARKYGESTGLTPIAGYTNELGETTGYVPTEQLTDPGRGTTVDVVTVKGTKVGTWDAKTGERPSVAEVNAVAEAER